MAEPDSDDELLSLVNEFFDHAAPGSDDEPAEVCELCDERIDNESQSKLPKLGYMCLDKLCFNALHTLERCMQKDRNLKTKVMRLIEEEPLKFKNVALKLRAPPRRRKQTVVMGAMDFLTVMVEERNKIRKQKQLLFTRRQFVAWHTMHEGMSDEEALDHWRSEKEHCYSEVINGKLCIAVDMPVELSSEHRLSRKSQSSGKHVDAESDGAKQSFLRKCERELARQPSVPTRLKPSVQAPVESSDADMIKQKRPRRLRSNSSEYLQKKTPRKATQPRPFASSDDDDEPFKPFPKASPQRGRSPKRSPRSTPTKQSRSDSDRPKKRDDSDSDRERERECDRDKKRDDTRDGEADGEPAEEQGDDLPILAEKLPPAAFHRFRKKWHINYRRKIHVFTSEKTSPLSKYAELWRKVKDTDEARSTEFPTSFAKLKKQVDVVRRTADEVCGWLQTKNLHMQQRGALQQLKELEKLNQKFMEDVDQLKEIRKDVIGVQGAEKKKAIRNIGKVVQVFVDAGCPDVVAACFAEVVANPEKALVAIEKDEQVEFDRVCCFDLKGLKFANAIGKAMDNHVGYIAGKPATSTRR